MNRNLLIALMAGVLGGMVTRYAAPPTAFAQAPSPIAKPAAREIRAQSFALIDQADRVVATFTAEPVPGIAQGAPRNQSMRIVLRDSNGRAIWSAGGTGVQPLTTRLEPR
jgi:hypothetical protein